MGGISRRALVACVLVVAMPLISAPSSATEPPEGWHQVPYFDYPYGWFRTATQHETFGGVRLTSTNLLSQGPANTTAEERDVGGDLEYIWGARCKKTDAQTVTMTRTLFLPGQPKLLKTSLSIAAGYLVKNNPITSVAIKVNGATIHEVLKANAPLPTMTTRTLVDVTSYADEFKYGENTITLVARKKATKKPLCTGDSWFGFGAELYGEFSADMQSGLTGTPTASQTNGAVIPVKVTNNGPTDWFPGAGSFELWAGSPRVTITNVFTSPSSFSTAGECQTYSYSPGNSDLGTGKRMQCPLPHIEPGKSISFNVLVAWSGFDCPGDEVYYTYSVNNYFSDNRANDGDQTGDRRFYCADTTARLAHP